MHNEISIKNQINKMRNFGKVVNFENLFGLPKKDSNVLSFYYLARRIKDKDEKPTNCNYT
jgi:hypothetical protein